MRKYLDRLQSWWAEPADKVDVVEITFVMIACVIILAILLSYLIWR